MVAGAKRAPMGALSLWRQVSIVVVVCTALLTTCGWDGPTAGVQVVDPVTSQPVDGPARIDDPGLEASVDGEGGVATVGDGGPAFTLPATDEGPRQPGDGQPGEGAPEDDNGDDGQPGVSIPDEITIPRRPIPGGMPGTVAVVGDSLTASATEEIDAVLKGIGLDVLVIDGAVSRRMAQGAEPVPGTTVIEQIAATTTPELWVIALGTNDVGAGESPSDFERDMRRLLDLIPAGAPVVWVDLWITDKQPAIEAANAQIRELIGQRPAAIVADWFSHGDDFGLVAHDGVHLTPDGQWVFATAIVEALVALYG